MGDWFYVFTVFFNGAVFGWMLAALGDKLAARGDATTDGDAEAPSRKTVGGYQAKPPPEGKVVERTLPTHGSAVESPKTTVTLSGEQYRQLIREVRGRK